MKIYTSTKKIPGLENLPLTERMRIIEQASNKMPVPEKTLLNILKLLVLIPVFVLVLRVVESWWSLAWAALILLLYPLLVKPLQYSMAVKHLPPQPKQNADADTQKGTPSNKKDDE
uniref:DUF6170 family protein n=1 Tax=Ningiella ruwaisensis TaxID=2364274 RepID=UPI00109F57CB|nr:DUF6170 family protein [Ningiella ruwaisensis]